MPSLARADSCGLLVVDVQSRFLQPIVGSDELVNRCRFMIQAAHALRIPVIASEQVPDKMGGTVETLADLGIEPFAKTRFSAAREEALLNWMASHQLTQVAIVGIETPICVLQTSVELVADGFEVFVVADAVSGRTESSHRLALERIQAAGADLAFSESLVYEWMEGADHPKFRDILSLVKAVNEDYE